MPKVKVYNMSGEITGEVELSEAVFGIEPNNQAIFASVKNHLGNLRQGTQSALTRGEVSGGGKKPYRQKGTGSARQGSTRTPHYYHGGIAFAPKPRSYRTSINKKVRRLAILSALSQKAADDAIIVVDGLEMSEIKTKTFQLFLNAVNVAGKALVVTPELNENVVKSARNIPGIQITLASILNAYDIVNANTFIVDKAALAKIEEVYA